MSRPAAPSLGPLDRYRPIVDDWPAFVEAMSRPAPACVWAHEGRIRPGALEAMLRADGVEPASLPWHGGAFRIGRPEGLGNHWWYRAGLCHAQEEASVLPVRLLDPRPGERVLDLCAAPGGKTAQISLAVGLRGTVVANEFRMARLRALRSTLDRLGLANVSLTHHDGLQFPVEAGPFDRVLVDAPCSDEGVVRRKPHLVETLGEKLSLQMSARQIGLLRRGLSLCRPGGRVVYSTCTFAPEENEAVVDAALGSATHPARVVEAGMPGFRTGPGLDSWNGRRFHPSLRHALRVWPHHRDTGGFFVAVLEREGEADPRSPAWRCPEPAPAEEWRPYAAERYEMPPSVWEPFLVFRRASRGLHVISRHHRAPVAPPLHATGLFLVRDRVRFPKLSSVGALLVGGHACRNRVELERSQVEAYYERRTLPLISGQDEGCDGLGYVVVTHRGHPLGTGLIAPEVGTLRSLYPRRWAGESS
ncbi:MAG: class I SAM-dependent methyltransferase [Acidobacteriota bacterium]|jgi:NOL1/NOP2/sun family putative RNA methylase